MTSTAFLAGAILLTVSCATAMMIDGEEMSMDDAIIKAGSNGSMSKMYEVMQDNETVMVELDMLFKMETYSEMVKEMTSVAEDQAAGRSRSKRKAIRSTAYRWTNNRVPYELSNEFSSRDRSVISSAINDYHRYTCLRFVPATSRDRNRVRFQNGGGCSSYVGMIGRTQPISLAPGCRYKGIVIHEMGHAIGFQHEQTRPDRDSFVYIQTQNIQRGVEFNFMRYSTNQVNNFNVPYDYTSVMHYSQNAFSRNGRPTIIARDSRFQNAMGNRAGFSFNDIRLANTIYNCASVNNCAARNCPQGFQGPDCKCWCDSGDRNNPVKECDGTGPVEPSVTTTTPRPMNCEDRSQYCPAWAAAGYCTGRYERYMSQNCSYSCRICDELTTTTTTTAAPAACRDENGYCRYWASRGECRRNPSYMEENCKMSCGTCQSSGGSGCEDMNENCPMWTRYCNNEVYSRYLNRNCRKSCGICTANDAAPTTTVAPVTKKMHSKCVNRWSDNICAKKTDRGQCAYNTLVRHNCAKACNNGYCDN